MLRPPVEDEDEYEVPPWLIQLGRLIGWSEITTRWRVVRARRRVYAALGMLVPTRGNRRVLRHQLRDVPVVSLFLVFTLCLVYGRMMLARPGQGWLGWDSATLLRFGAYYPPAIADGQWWRLGTAVALHIGLWHLGFNSLALTRIGPLLEQTFGGARLLFAFVATGVVSFLACYLLHYDVVSAGASGALMGLIGLAAAWGQRDGTTVGHQVRNDMIRWAVYTMVFGYFIGANNLAHGAGFVAGALLGLVFHPARLAATQRSALSRGLGLVGLVAWLGVVGLCLLPPRWVKAASGHVETAAGRYEVVQIGALLDGCQGGELARVRLEQPTLAGLDDDSLRSWCDTLRAGWKSVCAQPAVGPEDPDLQQVCARFR